MKQNEQQAGGKTKFIFRVVCGNDEREPKTARNFDRKQTQFGLDSEVEAYWAGRFPAARLSTRIAA